MQRKLLPGLILALLFTGLVLAACNQGATTEESTDDMDMDSDADMAEPAEPEVVEPEEPEMDEGPAPNELWAESAHAAADTEAFMHWNEDDPAEVPTSCAKCHSMTGFQDFIAADGSEFGSVEAAVPVGEVVNCDTCHNDAAMGLTSVVMPSGVEITDLGPSAVCTQCHQGRSHGGTVDEAIADLDLDTPSEELGFINIHYFAAAGSLFGGETHAGYEYAGKSYQGRNTHVEGYAECTDCHDQHSLEVKVEACTQCHDGVETVEDLHDQRMMGSLADYDGDGDEEEGIYYEIETLSEMLYTAMQTYGADKGTAIVYESHTYPYFFVDTNADGEAGEDEANFGNQYKAWTPRLLQAAYNYQVAQKDPGAFAHNPKYVIALLYDSIESLNEVNSTPVDLSGATRNDPGHFDGTAEAFRHWDEDEPAVVPASCSKCHSAEGIPTFLETGETADQPPANGYACVTCHTFEDGFTIRGAGAEVTFPSGAVLTLGDDATSNLCMNCHQGRSSTVSVNDATAGIEDDAVGEELGFINIHYFAAGATLFGADAQGAYQYDGKEYVGQRTHVENYNECAECHNVHALEVRVDECAACHQNEDLDTYRMDGTDWDGDGDTDEGVRSEIAGLNEILYAEIVAYSASNADTATVQYNAGRYPYFFTDLNGNGVIDGDDDRYATWTPAMLRAAYNYQYAAKDPGAFAHNPKYVIQALYDSIEALGGDVSGLTRP